MGGLGAKHLPPPPPTHTHTHTHTHTLITDRIGWQTNYETEQQ